jgi:hypothetical protein
MGLKDCLIASVEAGDITREEASALADDFDERFAQLKNGMSEDAARSRAREDMAAALQAEAKERRRRADLTEARRIGVKRFLQGYRNKDGQPDVFAGAMALLSHYGFRGTSSVRGRTEAIIAGAQKNLDEVMFSFERRGLLGRRANRAMMPDFVKELHGEASGDATAKQLARAVETVFEDLRQRFNAAGGAIGKLEKFGLPHSHDRIKVKSAGREEWKAYIRALLDPARMVNPLTGEPVGQGGLDTALDHVYDSIVSQNRAHLEPAMTRRGRGSIASQRQDERFLQFRDASGWLEYNRRFGKGDPVQAIFNHVNGMARDIAAMEILGPNPSAMVEYMKQVAALEIGKREAGKESLAKSPLLLKNSDAAWVEHRIDSLWQALRGRPTVASGWSNFAANLRNVLIAAQLGKTVILAAATDPFVARASRQLAGLPVTATIHKMVQALATEDRKTIIRSGVIWDEYLHVAHDELRFSGPAVGAEWSRWLADRGVTWSGLQPLTTARKLVEARAWQAHIADQAGKTFGQLDARFRTALEGFGVDSPTWELWRKSIDPDGFVTPRQIELNGGAVQYLDMAAGPITSPEKTAEAKALAHRAAAEKLSEVISSWSERSVPAGTPNARSVITGKAERGTFSGEMIDYMLQYKSFGLSFTAMQIEATMEMAAQRGGGKGFRSGLGYLAPLTILLTLGGAVYLQIGALLDGKKPEDMNPASNAGFWLKAVYTGGGFGLFGDFVKSTENRFGQSPFETLLGPGPAALGDAFKLTLGNAQSLATGQKTNVGRQAVQDLRRYTPILSSNWLTRGVYNRLVLDNLQFMLDPSADKSFKAQATNAKKNGTPFFIAPGQYTPLHLQPRN